MALASPKTLTQLCELEQLGLIALRERDRLAERSLAEHERIAPAREQRLGAARVASARTTISAVSPAARFGTSPQLWERRASSSSPTAIVAANSAGTPAPLRPARAPAGIERDQPPAQQRGASANAHAQARSRSHWARRRPQRRSAPPLPPCLAPPFTPPPCGATPSPGDNLAARAARSRRSHGRLPRFHPLRHRASRPDRPSGWAFRCPTARRCSSRRTRSQRAGPWRRRYVAQPSMPWAATAGQARSARF